MIPSDHIRPLLMENFVQCGIRKEDVVFVNGDPTGPIDKGIIKEDDPSSGMSRARREIPAAAARLWAK
jgi:hypothetical protein